MQRKMQTIIGWLRDGWLILGLALVALVSLELAFQATRTVRHALRGEEVGAVSSDHPYAGKPWFALWESREGAVTEPDRYDPYRGWWPASYQFRYVNVDSAGRRVTLHPSPEEARTRRVFMLGGSTMWGFTARDSATIPALVAAELHRRGFEDVEVINLAQSAYTLTQGTVTLLLELRQGNVPDAVVFLDGNNEVAPTFQSGRAGRILNQALFEHRAQQRRGFWGEVFGLGRHSGLVNFLDHRFSSPSRPGEIATDPEALCSDVALQYRNLTRMVEGMSQEFGFPTLFFWQPLRATTRKPLTPWEQSIGSPDGYREMVQRCTVVADSLMMDRLGRSYFPLHSLFDADTSSVFLDDYGHITEEANAVVAARIVELLAPLLAEGANAGRAAIGG